ncbi:MAG: AEC family transporter [Alphaproteobacteria bacterium]|nr:MAG: AEC family transporter [Alphaproteobacteria bacterium]
MAAVLNIILPVFGIMLTGYLCGRFRVLGEASSQALNAFVYYVSLPALFFISMARVEIGEAFHAPFLMAFGGGLLGSFGLAMLIGTFVFPNRLAALGLHAITAVFSNTGYLGIPLLLTAFGEAGKLPGIISTVIMGAVVMPVGLAIVEIDLSQDSHPLRIVRNVLIGVAKSPLVLSAVAGLLVSALGWPVPVALATFGDILGAAAAPCALFAIGLFMVGRSVTAGLGEVGWLVGMKLLVHPALTAWLAYGVLRMDPVWAAAAVMQAALPTGALAFVLAQQYGIYVQRATAAIMISTVLSVVTLSVLLTFLGVG